MNINAVRLNNAHIRGNYLGMLLRGMFHNVDTTAFTHGMSTHHHCSGIVQATETVVGLIPEHLKGK